MSIVCLINRCVITLTLSVNFLFKTEHILDRSLVEGNYTALNKKKTLLSLATW